jgi:hypothetical protein
MSSLLAYLINQVDTIIASVYQGARYFLRIYPWADGIFYEHAMEFDSERMPFNPKKYFKYVERATGGTDITQVYDQILRDTTKSENPSLGAIILSDFEASNSSYAMYHITAPVVLGLVTQKYEKGDTTVATNEERSAKFDFNLFATPKSTLVYIDIDPKDVEKSQKEYT